MGYYIDNIYLTRDWKQRQLTPINRFTQHCKELTLYNVPPLHYSVLFKMERKELALEMKKPTRGNDSDGPLSLLK